GSESKIDIVLLDLNLGEEDGWEAFQALKASRPELPIIVASGQADRLRHASASLASAALEKPFDLGTLLRLLLATTKPSEPKGKRLTTRLGLWAGLLLSLSGYQAKAVPVPSLKIDSLTVRNGTVAMSWQGTGNVQVQIAPAVDGPWSDIGSPTTGTS